MSNEIVALQGLVAAGVVAMALVARVVVRRVAPQHRALTAAAIVAGLSVAWFVVLRDLLFAAGDLTANVLGVSVAINIGFFGYTAGLRMEQQGPDPAGR